MIKSLKDFARIPEDPVTGVLYASTLRPHKQLHTHYAFFRPNGSSSDDSIPFLTDRSWQPEAHPLAKDGLTNPAVLKAWFHLASGDWSALAQVSSQAKKKGESGDQAKLLLERAEAFLTERATAFEARKLDLAAHIEGTALVERLARSPAHKETSKALAEKLRAAAKEEPLKSELLARLHYFKLVPMQVSLKRTENEAAKAGYQQLAKKYPDTVFGRKAQASLDIMLSVAAN